MPDHLRTPGVQNKEDDFLSMTNEGANALNVMSHTKEVQNSAANKIMQRLIYLKDKDSGEEDFNPHEESPQILRRSLTFHPDTDSQPHERLLVHFNYKVIFIFVSLLLVLTDSPLLPAN